jgi:hypothetical protein
VVGRRADEELGKLAEVLRRGGEQKLVPRPTWAAQAQPVEAQDALQMCKLHLDLLAVAPRARIGLGAEQ